VIVTLDSGIYVSAMEYGGIPKEALVHAIEADELLVCVQIEIEVVRVMCDKFRHNSEDIQRRLAGYVSDAKRVVVRGSISGICRDPNDDFILECAATGNADLIVTGDKDLLSLKTYGITKILTPRQYLDISGN
jgi:putative PIN family toxin of toxin-antitoxin system